MYDRSITGGEPVVVIDRPLAAEEGLAGAGKDLVRLGGGPCGLGATNKNSLWVKFCLRSLPAWCPIRARRSDSFRLFFKTDAFLYSQNWLG